MSSRAIVAMVVLCYKYRMNRFASYHIKMNLVSATAGVINRGMAYLLS